MNTQVAQPATTMFALQMQVSDGDGTCLPLIVSLHDRGGDAASAVAAARAAFGAGPRVIAPQAARPCNPMLSNFAGAHSYAGFTWHLGENERPEPASFGDSLAQLEMLLDDAASRVILFGHGQGAVLAVALALHGAACVAGIAVDRPLVPAIEGWRMPERSASPLPCLVLNENAGDDARLSSLGIACTSETIHAWLARFE